MSEEQIKECNAKISGDGVGLHDHECIMNEHPETLTHICKCGGGWYTNNDCSRCGKRFNGAKDNFHLGWGSMPFDVSNRVCGKCYKPIDSVHEKVKEDKFFKTNWSKKVKEY